VHVLNLNEPRRLGNQLPKLEVHRGKVLDFSWNPFNDQLLATASEDCHLKVSAIPEGGLKEHCHEALVDLAGHEKKVVACAWHPTSNNVLASAGFDRTVKVWDVEAPENCLLDYASQHGDALQHMTWNRDGSQMATTCKDKKMRIFDPRDQKVVAEVAPYQGSKKSSVVFLTAQNLIATIGFTRTTQRQIQIWDPRNMSQKCKKVDIDQSAGVMIPWYDHDTSILYIGGKGDSSIKYWECVDTGAYLHFLSQFSSTVSQKGFCFLPKTSCDVMACEIATCLRVTRDEVTPVSFIVPRKADQYQSDLYPDTPAGIKSNDAKDFFAGENGVPELTSMRPGERRGQNCEALAVKKTYAELEEALAVAEKRIAELEAQIGA